MPSGKKTPLFTQVAERGRWKSLDNFACRPLNEEIEAADTLPQVHVAPDAIIPAAAADPATITIEDSPPKRSQAQLDMSATQLESDVPTTAVHVEELVQAAAKPQEKAAAKAKAKPKAKGKAAAQPPKRARQQADDENEQPLKVAKQGDRHSAKGVQDKAAYARLNYRLKTKKPDKHAEYLQMAWQQKQAWLSQFRVDPSMAWLEGSTTTAVEASSGSHADGRWLTEEQLASPNWLNSADHAKVVFCTLPLQPHPEIECLAQAGVEAVWWKTSWKSVADMSRETTQVKGCGQMDKEDYEKVRDKMLDRSTS